MFTVNVFNSDGPIANQEVILNGGTVTTNDRGQVLVDLPAGRHRISYGNTAADFSVTDNGQFNFKVG